MSASTEYVIVGDEPKLAGQRCTGFMLRQFHEQLRITNMVSVAYLRFGEQWHRLNLETATIFWRSEAPSLIPNSGLEFGSVLNDLSGMDSVVGQTVESVGYASSDRGDMRAVIVFCNGKRLEFVYSYETDSTTMSC